MKLHALPRPGPHWLALGLCLLLPALAAFGAAPPPAPEADPATAERLKKFLQRFPQADANGDGVLTESEARAFRQTKQNGKASASAAPRGPRAPAQADVAYGPHARNVLDCWTPGGDRPAPVLIFFHGGSFKAGDKSLVQSRPILDECLAAGIAVVSANYRFSSDAPFPAPMRDGARVVQFVRSKAKEWNLDPDRIAVSGSSAGATMALWIALHDDLAEPSSADPVARLSSRVACASPHSGPAGLEPEYIQKSAGVTKLGAALWQLFGASSQAELESPERRPLIREASPINHATPDDPPLFLTYAGTPAEAPFAAGSTQKDWIHHVSLGLPLQAKYRALGRECDLYHRGEPAGPGAEIAFLKKHLMAPARTADR
ncbi:MAG: alpha/beta hydrolase fold domain-containing protein [Planctomycetota bacterium]